MPSSVSPSTKQSRKPAVQHTMNTSTFSLAEASELLEVSPLIKQLQVVTWVADQQVSIEIIDFNSRHTIWECSDNV
jgi:hypothetical protein